ncbi:MAG: hypothetical protein ACK2U9_25240, partial [Anaerolineae bacterium]
MLKALHLLRDALVLCAIAGLGLLASTPTVQARSDPDPELQELVDQFAPVLYFHPDEIFRPQSVDVMLRSARLRQSRGTLPDVNILSQVTTSALPAYQDV